MTQLTTYVNFDEVRAILGVDDTEIPDETLNLSIYVAALSEELGSISDSLDADFLLLKDTEAGSLTSEQTKLYQATTTFCTYSLAKQVAESLSMTAFKTLSDGKASVARFNNATEDVKDNISARYYKTKKTLTTISNSYYNVDESNTATLTNITGLVAAEPTNNPVTNT